jgi:integrase
MTPGGVSGISCDRIAFDGIANHSLNRSAPIHLVQATLGHASVATTDLYLHVRPNDSSAPDLGVDPTLMVLCRDITHI